jgi:hypothetical protein
MSADLDRWRRHSRMSDPGSQAAMIDALPHDIGDLCRAVQGVLLHADWCTSYGLDASHFGPDARTTLPLEQRLRSITEADPRPLDSPRTYPMRSPGTCRDYALMLCGALRHRGVPARVRCGFAAYFSGGTWEDHWICEYHRASDDRWRRADAQLDEVQRKVLGIAFDITDLPDALYVTAAEAWNRCRTSRDDAARFGHGAVKGLWFVRVNVVRDHYALNDAETSPWDTWRRASGPHLLVGESDRHATDDLARHPDSARQPIAPPWLV